MSDKAEKTEDQQIETPETPEEEKAEEGLEVVVSEDVTPPSSDSVPLAAHMHKIDKWKDRVEKAKDEKSAVEAENELLRMRLQNANKEPESLAPIPPNPIDFVSTEEFNEAHSKFSKELSEYQKKVGRESFREEMESVRQEEERKASLKDREKQAESALVGYYDRASKLSASDFQEAEDKVMSTLGKDAALQVIQTFGNSEAVVYALGHDEARLSQMATLLKSNPVKGIVELTRFAEKVSLKPKSTETPAPDDTTVPAASFTDDFSKELSKLRERSMKGEAVMDQILSLKERARAQGVSL